MFKAEWRYVYNDAMVSEWRPIHELRLYDTVMEAYAGLSEFLTLVPDRVGFTEQPDLGKIAPAIGTDAEPYGLFGFSLFQHPNNDHWQYRIAETHAVEAEEQERLITL